MTTPDFTSAAKSFTQHATSQRKLPVRLATAAALAAYTRSGNTITLDANGALSVDGVTVAVGDRILLTHGAAAADNGIYEVVATGGASARAVLTRAWDADNSSPGLLQAGTKVYIQAGATRAGHEARLATTGTITVNTTGQVWADRSPIQRGTATLVSGTATVDTTIVLTANSKIFLTHGARPTGSTNYAGLAVVATTPGAAGTAAFTIEAIIAAGTIDSDAAGAVHWMIID